MWAWGLWDWGSSGFQHIALTFVFSVYLTDAVGADLPGPVSANSWLAWSTAAAGVLIALMAPVIGQSADRTGRRVRATGLWTALVVLCMAGMFAVRDDWSYLWLGLLLLALASIFVELAYVSYYALMAQVSTPATVGRVSGFGWSLGYIGGIVLLLVVYVFLLSGDGGLLGVPTTDGLDVRIAVLVAAVWFAVFAAPMFLLLPRHRRRRRTSRSWASSARTAGSWPTCASCTGRARTPCTSSGRARSTGTASTRCSPSAGSSPSPCTAWSRDRC